MVHRSAVRVRVVEKQAKSAPVSIQVGVQLGVRPTNEEEEHQVYFVLHRRSLPVGQAQARLQGKQPALIKIDYDTPATNIGESKAPVAKARRKSRHWGQSTSSEPVVAELLPSSVAPSEAQAASRR